VRLDFGLFMALEKAPSGSSLFALGSSQAEPLQANVAEDTLVVATPAKRKRGKSLSRRTGQDGHIEKSGRWFVVRFWKDIPGKEKRMHVRERICPISGPGLLSKSERKRKAREIVQASGADSAEYFKEVVKQDTGVTFREQSEIWLKQLQNRKRKPIRQSYAVTIQGALDKWILPAIGNTPLANVDNLAVKPLIEKMASSGLKPRTVNKYIEHVKQAVESRKSPNGEPIHNRKWDAETMDLPIVEHAEQKRPSLKADSVSKLIQTSSGQEQALYVLLAATGMRVSEALAVETRHFTNDGHTINVEQQVEKDSPTVVKDLKTAAAKRQVDLHPDIAEYLQHYTAGKTGLLFHTANGTPHLYGNLADRWLTPRLIKMGLDEEGMGWHSLKRFRKTWLRGARCLEDLNNFWLAHKPQTMSEVYSHLHEELQLRLHEAKRVGYGFVLPASNNVSVVPNVPKLHQNSAVEIAA
jgi:integrase